jgi:hypothetical protein
MTLDSIIIGHLHNILKQGGMTMSCRETHQRIPKDTSPGYLGMTWIQFECVGK